MAGFPLGAVVAFVGLNDLMYAHKLNKDAEARNGKTKRETQREDWKQWDKQWDKEQGYQPIVGTQLGVIEVKSSPVPECQPSDLPELGTARSMAVIPEYETDQGTPVTPQKACEAPLTSRSTLLSRWRLICNHH